MFESKIYYGSTFHQRFFPVVHSFRYPVFVMAIDLDELGELHESVRGFSYNSWNIYSIFDGDYLTGKMSIQEGIEAALLREFPEFEPARIILVSTPRFFKKIFNPVSFYYCYDLSGDLFCVVAEVHNTYHERHLYFVQDEVVEKSFHVSPFFDEEGTYRFQLGDIREGLDIHIYYEKESQKMLYANLKGKTKNMDSKGALETMVRFPGSALLSMPRILWQAARLHYGKKLPVKGRPVPISHATILSVPATWFQRLAMGKLFKVLEGLKEGRMRVKFPDGSIKEFGESGEFCEFEIRDYRFFSLLARGGDVGLGEAYMLGYWDTVNDLELVRVLRLLVRNMDVLSVPDKGQFGTRLMNSILHYSRHNSIANSKSNISAHYDLGNEFYDLFLDSNKQYSSGIFETGEEDLETAQGLKINRLIQKLGVGRESHVLEIGSGWGGFAIALAKATGCRVTSLTISRAQYEEALSRVKKAGLSDRVEIVFQDYREHGGCYDAIVSIEMLEAVGHRYFGSYFRTLEHCLKPNGRVVLQVITIPDQRYMQYLKRSDWIQKYIFPGGHLPSLEAIQKSVKDHSQFVIEDLENIGTSYALTLVCWRDRFLSRLDELGGMGFDDVFIRKWVYYFSYCEAGFAERYIGNLQLVLSRPLERGLV